jgi:ATPase complex subunit ATP10
VGRGLTEDVRDAMGFLNSQVGYVYLLDTECRIRWAGSGHAWKGEVEWLNMGIKRLLEETKERKRVEGRSKTLASVPKESRSKERELEKDHERAIA